MMNYGRLRILLVSIASIVILSIAGIIIYNYLVWGAPLSNNEKFVKTWNTYSYQDYAGYPGRVKPYLETTYYNDNFTGDENIQSNEIIAGKLIAQNKSVSISNISVKSKSIAGSNYTITTSYTETTTQAEGPQNTPKTITVTYDKAGGNFYVTSISYS